MEKRTIDLKATVTVTKGYIFRSKRVFELDCHFLDTVPNIEKMLNWLMDTYVKGSTANNVAIDYDYNITPIDDDGSEYIANRKDGFDDPTVEIRKFVGFRELKITNNTGGGGTPTPRAKIPTAAKAAAALAAGYAIGKSNLTG